MSRPEVSVVIPVYNECENIPLLWETLTPALDACAACWEVLWVDDGSTDDSGEQIRRLRLRDPRARQLRLEDNQGQSVAFWCGFTHARFATIVTLDADLQNDPLDIPLLLSALADADVAIGWRQTRSDSLAKRIASKVANAFRNWVTNETIPDVGCSLKAFRRTVFDSFFPFHGMHRFYPTLARIAGYRVAVVPVRHHARRYGKSKYGICDRFVGPLVDCWGVRWMQRRYLGSINVKETTDE